MQILDLLILHLSSFIFACYSLEFTQTSAYNEQWKSSGGTTVSLWKPLIQTPGFYLLGDVAVNGANKPSRSALLVRESRAGDLAAPLGRVLAWSNAGTSREVKVAVYRLLPPHGYRCIGMVVEKGYSVSTNLQDYRCVKTDLVEVATSMVIWDSLGTSIYIGGYLNLVLPDPDSSGGGLDCQHFVMRTSSLQVAQVWVLNSRHLVPTDEGAQGEAVLSDSGLQVLIQGTGKRVWQDGLHSRAIFSPHLTDQQPNFYRVGSYMARPGSSHKTYLVSGTMGKEIQFPATYNFLMSDLSRVPIYLWRPVCRSGYRNIGVYATNTQSMPANDTVCVHESFISSEYISWNFARTDPSYRNTWWQAIKRFSDLEMRSMTHTSKVSLFPTYIPAFLDLDKVEILRGGTISLTGYILTGVVLESYGVVTTIRSLDDNESLTFSSQVSSRWNVGHEITPGVPVNIKLDWSGVPSGSDLSRKYSTIIRDASKDVSSFGTYTTFIVKDKSDVSATQVREVWLDIPFTASLYDVRGTTSNSRPNKVTGTLNLIIRQQTIQSTADQ